MPIRRLSPALVNQIAAGEVVERPASVVKELLENAFDAGAARIEIEIAGGGRDLIRVSDDGGGIDPADLPLAVESHATSKVSKAADLDAISTMGFRGEALASIAAVGRFSIESRTPDHEEAWRLEVVDGRASEPVPAAGPVGTRVEVRHLFQAIPARRRFLKSESAESTRVAEVVRLLALTRPAVGIRLVSNGRTLLDLPATEDPARRILGVLGPELEGRLLPVAGEIGEASDGTLVTCWGLVGTPETARPTARQQRFVLNGRAIVDRALAHALKEGFRGLVDPGRHPIGVIHLEMDPARVDVNVHPAKTEVRFREARPLHGLVRRAVRAALVEADLARELPLSDSGGSTSGGTGRSFEENGDRPAVVGGTRSPSAAADANSMPSVAAMRAAVAGVDPPKLDQAADPAVIEVLPRLVGADAVLQIHESFLVTQDEHGLVIIDQHALHERVMFETLARRISEGSLESQRQLVPEVFDAEPAQVEAIESIGPLLERLGIDASPAGPRSIAVHAFPSLLLARRVEAAPFVSELLERAAAGQLEREDDEAALAEVLDMMSCKAAVKAGDRLRPKEIAELLDMRDRIDRGASCPHGRPTHLRISIPELERRFGRSGG
ncbi:MAG: DNA mismatch repair endonuclease MutL [Planctomycetota bacterium]|nr:DNA mismatch repair endonuclease MutL [Planctomycetota bacterium]